MYRKSFANFLIAPLLVWALCAASAAQSLDVRVTLKTPDADLNKFLANASLVAELANQTTPKTQDVLAAARADYERIVTALYHRAYYAPVVTITIDGTDLAVLPQFTALKTIKSVVIRVDPGRPFRFGRTKIAPLAPKTDLPIGFATDQPANLSILRETVETGISAWRDAGHAKASLQGENITAHHPSSVLDADITLTPGPRLRFGNLQISGNSAVRSRRIRQIAGLPSGHVFSPAELKRVAARLRRTGTFRTVSISESETIGPDNTLDIAVQVSETLPRRIGFGAEISSLEGLGLSTFWLHRNLFGGAERLRLDAEISGIGGQSAGTDYRLKARFDRPATFNEDTDFYLETELEHRDEVNFKSDIFSIETGIKRYVGDQREYTLGLGYRFSDVTDAFGKRNFQILTLPVSATFDYRDKPLDAKSGFFAKAAFTPFANIKGTKNGVLSKLDLRAYKTVGAAQNLTFALRGQLGSLIGPDLSNAPTDFLFYSGGGGTVRGQKYQSLSVDLGGGNRTGGRSFLGLSGEARFRLREKLALVGFYDAGYIGTESVPDGKSGQWHSGAGLGLRYDTGIGPIRVDLAVPVSGPGRNSGFEIYIGIGQSF